MRRIFEDAAYARQSGSFWAETVKPLEWQCFQEGFRVDVAVIGGGFTGLNAALTLAKTGASVAVFEAESSGWGASGRNGGFCCLGGSKLGTRAMTRRYGVDSTREWQATEGAAIDHVEGLIKANGWDVDRHSKGETLLAHSARAWESLRRDADEGAILHEAGELAGLGMAGPWKGGVTTPKGFALNPRKYHDNLARLAEGAGARLFADAPVTEIKRDGDWRLRIGPGETGQVIANTVILATNGYSAEDLPDWLRARYLPVQSSVIVTAPMSLKEQEKAGWTSAQMAYDSRFLLHYFRLLPDGRFLFGMRGGLRATKGAQKAVSGMIRRDFLKLFPGWQDVEITHEWSGLVCLMRSLTPFVGAVPGHPGLFAAMGFHGNGVAMGSYAGKLIANKVLGEKPQGPCPDFLGHPPGRFPLGRFRRALLTPAYLLAQTLDL